MILAPRQEVPYRIVMRRTLWYCVLTWVVLASLSERQVAGASEQSVNGNMNVTLVVNMTADAQNRTVHKKDSPSIHVLALEFEAVKEPLIFTVVVLLAGISKIGFHHADFLSSKVPESCMLIILGTIFGSIIHFSKVSDDLPKLFDPHRFFLFLLPPIILESAFSLYDRAFSDNIGTVLLFAVVGTVISCFLIGLSLYGLMLAGALGEVQQEMSLVQILLFSSFIVAVDPVAVLAVFAEVGVNDVLYFIVFGESLLNDGVTVVLYKVMQTLNLMDEISGKQIVLGIIKFFVVCFGGLLIGIISGIIAAFLTRVTKHVGVTQPLVVYTMAYLGFLLSELFEVSGIISVIACGLFERHYTFSNINHKARTTVKYFTKVLASASEIIIFLFLGLALVSDDHRWYTGFTVWALLLCTVYRFIITFSIACLINRFDTMRVRRIGYDEMFMIAFGGLRGAVAFSLAALLSEEDVPMKDMFVTTTLAIIMFTVFFQGITIKPLVHLMSIGLAPEKNKSMYCELHSHVTDHLMAGMEEVIGMRGRNYIREVMDNIDIKYFKKWLMNEPDQVDKSLMDFYNKIVVKEHYRNMKLCGANVAEPGDIPRVNTEMYLPRPPILVSQESFHSDHDPDEDEVRIRHRRNAMSISVENWQTLRDLLVKSNRESAMGIHASYDPNLAYSWNQNIQARILKKSERNQTLQHMLSVSSTRPPLERSTSWRDKDSNIAMRREEEHHQLNDNGSQRRAVSVDLGHQTAIYRSQTSQQSSPSSLDAVFEEDEETMHTVTGPLVTKPGNARESVNGDEGKRSKVKGGEGRKIEARPLIDRADEPTAAPGTSREGFQGRQRSVTSTRHRLERQNDLKNNSDEQDPESSV